MFAMVTSSALRRQALKNEAQEERLNDLELENEQLKLYLASLARLLVNKGVLSEGELNAFVDIIDED